MKGGNKRWVRVQTATKAESAKVGFRPAAPIKKVEEGEEEKEEMPFIAKNKAHSRHILFPSAGLWVSA
jgi:hypothetical protein